MKKYILINFILLVFTLEINGQTRDEDYTYIIEHYLSQESNNNYMKKELLYSEMRKNENVMTSISITDFKTLNDGKHRGIAVVYREKKNNNELKRTIVLCIPEKNSSEIINSKSLSQIKDLNDEFVLKYIVMGLITLGIEKN